MEILIPGALPPSPIAPELIQYIESACPHLLARFHAYRAQVINLHPDETGCSPFEAIELQRRGFTLNQGLNLGAGLGPLRAGAHKPDEQVWIAELSSVAIGQQGPSLILPASLQITQDESDALFDAVAELWTNSPISLLPVNATHWRIWLPTRPVVTSMSPQALAGMALADWWPQHESLRGWRKLLNEIQMVWYEHPVNANRVERGLPPINSLWLYGGAQGWKPSEPEDLVVFDALEASHKQSDWGTWINTLPALSTFIAAQPQDASITLLGQTRGIQLSATKRAWWNRFLPAKKHNWKSWWNLQN